MPTESRSIGPIELTEPALVDWGVRIGASSRTPVVLALRGDLGAGKSVLARAVARGAGVRGPMPSPTFNLVFVYPADDGVVVRHLDLYRLREPEEVRELGWRELGTGEEIVIIEWPERAEALLPPDRWDIWLDTPDPTRPVRMVRAERRGAAPALAAPAPAEPAP